MLAVPYFFSYAMAELTIERLHLLKVSCLSFARLRLSYALDPHISDHEVIIKTASITLSNRSIEYKPYFPNAVKNETSGFDNSLS